MQNMEALLASIVLPQHQVDRPRSERIEVTMYQTRTIKVDLHMIYCERRRMPTLLPNTKKRQS